MSTFDDNFPAKGNPKMSDRVFGFDSESLKNAGMTNQALYDLFKTELDPTLPKLADFLPAFDLENARVMTSTAPDGKIVKSNVLNPVTNEVVTFKEVEGISDANVDGIIYLKSGDKYFADTDFLSTRVVNVKKLGAINDDTFDNAPVFQFIEGFLSKYSGRCTLRFPPSGSYYTTRHLNIRHNVDVDMHSAISYNGPDSVPAISVGSATNDNQSSVRIRVRRRMLSNWENDSVGVQLINFNGSTDIHIIEARDFTENIRLIGDSRGFSYNKVYLGSVGQGKYGLRGTNRNSGWFNENIIFGGRFWAFSSTNPLKDRYGVVIDSLDGSYTNNNNNNFYEPSFEMRTTSSAPDNIPILVVHGVLNSFVDVRDERYIADARIIIRTLNASRYNTVQTGYSDRVITVSNVEDLGSDPTTFISSRFGYISTQSPRNVIYNSGDLSKRVCEYNATQLGIEDELFFAYSYESSIKKNAEGIKGQGFITLNSTVGVGVRVDSTRNKRFEIRTLASSIGTTRRINIRAYNSEGIILTGTSPRYVTSESIRQSTYSGSIFGGSYRTPNNSVENWYIVLNPNVSYFDVIISGDSASNAVNLKSFQVLSIDNNSTIINPFTRQGLYASISPTSSDYDTGTVIYNASPNGPVGWRHAGSGVWEPFGSKTNASANTATVASGATPTKAEFDALLTELRDLKTKMRTAGLLAT